MATKVPLEKQVLEFLLLWVQQGRLYVLNFFEGYGIVGANGKNTRAFINIELAFVNDPCFVVPELKEPGIEVRAASAALAQAIIDVRYHSGSSGDRRMDKPPTARSCMAAAGTRCNVGSLF
jgi:hypothetical protein